MTKHRGLDEIKVGLQVCKMILIRERGNRA
jgi:hypothetical protein